MKSNIFKSLGWLSALVATFTIGLGRNVSAQSCNLTFSPNPATLTSYVTAYPYYNGSMGIGQQLIATFAVDVTNQPNQPIPNGIYPAWCVDGATDIDPVYETVPGTLYTGQLYSDCDPNLNSELPPGHPNTLVSPAVWNEVNYILNYHMYNGSNAFYWDVQTAINTLVGSAVGSPNPCGGLYTTPTPSGGCEGYPVFDPIVVNALLTAASNNAPNWTPGCGDVIGVVWVPGTNNQFLLLPVPVPCAPCVGVTKTVACLGPTNSCSQFGKVAEGYVGAGCASGPNEPAFCYQITITNCGTTPLTNVIVSDNLLGNLTTNYFTSPNQVFAPGATLTSVFTMAFAASATNTVTVTGEAALTQPVTNGAVVITNGTTVTASDTAIALVDTASVSCNLSLYSPLDLDGNPTDNSVTLPAATYYSSNNPVLISIQVCNPSQATLTNVTISMPGLGQFNCSAPGPFTLAPGACPTFNLCLGIVTCPANINLGVSVSGQVLPDAGHCAVYDLSSTNPITVCSSCSGTIMCTNGTGCLNGTANVSGTVVLHCNAANGNTTGDTGLQGVTVNLLNASSTVIGTTTTDVNGNYTFTGLSAGIYYVQVIPPAGDVETYPAGNNNSTLPVIIVVCHDVTGVNFGYANTTPPIITVTPGSNLGCNPITFPTTNSIASNITAVVFCGTATTNITSMDSNTGCSYTRTFTITVTDTYGNSSTNTSLSYTWTSDSAAPQLSGVPAGTNYGCNPASVASLSNILSTVTALDTCSPATVSGSSTNITNGCVVSEIFTIIATNACGNMATAYVTNMWTADTTTPTLMNVPAGTNYGCNPSSVASLSAILSGVTASDTCSPATISGSSTNVTNGCVISEIFTITATNACGNMATAYVTNMWTADTTPPMLQGVPAGTNYGCNPSSVASLSAILSGVTASDTCSPATVSGSSTNLTNGCVISEIFTITATNACGNMAAAYVTNMWTADTTPPMLQGVPAGTNYGCNPSSVASLSAILSGVTASDTCSPATVSGSSTNLTNGCLVSEIFTIVATNACGNMATAYVTNTWTADSAPPVLHGVPAGTNYGCNPSSMASLSAVLSGVTASDTCSPATVSGSCSTSTNGCVVSQVFTIMATNACGNKATAYVTNMWTADSTPPVLHGVPAGTNYGCNPSSVASLSAILSGVTASDTCSPATLSGSATNYTNGCVVSEIFMITATNACGNKATAYVTNMWTADTTMPTLMGVPAGTNYGCNPKSVASLSSILSGVTASDTCSPATVSGSASTTSNGCVVTEIFTITATNACGNIATAYVTNTWTADSSTPMLNGVPAGTNYGCNPKTVATVSTLLTGITASDTCSAATVSATSALTTNGCVVTQLFTITATNACGNIAMAYVTNTWTTDTSAPVLKGVPAGTNYGCNPTSVATTASVQALVTATDTCSPATVKVTAATTTNGCLVTQVFTIIATNACSNMATACVTNTWTADTMAPTLKGIPAGTNYGCNPTSMATLAAILSGVTASDSCSPATVTGSAVTTTNGCGVTEVFTIMATNGCGNKAVAYVTNTWTAMPPVMVTNYTYLTNISYVTNTTVTTNSAIVTNVTTVTNITVTTNCCTNSICGNFNSQNPGSGWLWLNAHCSAAPGSNCTVYCQNGSVTLACNDGKSYTYAIPNGCINFSSSCSVATNWFDGTNWNTTLPCAGDSQIFLQGCAIPWLSDFANCQSVCWTATFCSSAPGLSCNWQWGAACYNDTLPSCGSIAPKACQKTSCPNGAYYNSSDAAGSPENHKPYCVGGATGGGAANCTGSWSGTSTTCTFGTKTNITTTPVITYTTNVTYKTNSSVTTVTTVTTNSNAITTYAGPVLSGVPVGTNFGCNPASVPTAAGVQAGISASATCSAANIQVTGVNTTNGCQVTQLFTIIAMNACGNSTVAYVTNTWTADTTPPTITGVPAGGYLGCSATNLPGDTNVYAEVKAIDLCGNGSSLIVTHVDSTNSCLGSRTFTITSVDGCGNVATTNLTYTWTVRTPDYCTNVITCTFNSQNPGSGWLWCNAHASGNPGQSCTLYCQNATICLKGKSGKLYTYPVPNGCINFSPSCTVATNWFDGTNWNTTLPCAGDSQIFLQGCAIPWNSDFAGCQSATWTGVFSCTTPGLSFNWQFGAACYANTLPAYTNICPKACQQTSCQNGQYFNGSDQAGCPENHKPYCVGGGTGGGGANCTGSWSGTDTTCTFAPGTVLPPVLNGVPASDCLGLNPTNIPTLSSILAGISVSDTCSPATITDKVSVTTNTCMVTQIFTITAVNGCGSTATAYVTNTWTTMTTTNNCTNSICCSFTSQNPGSGWLWCNAHISGKPGNTNPITVYCQNATITLTCKSGKTYTYPIPNGCINFSPTCATGTNWFDGTQWNTTVPCSGDDQIFLQGCGIPWNSDFAGCQSACWSGVFSCNKAGFACNWQWGAACYNNTQPTCANIAPKACHQVPCQNGYYYNSGDQAGCPENHSPYCVGAGTSTGSSNCTGNWSNPGTCSF